MKVLFAGGNGYPPEFSGGVQSSTHHLAEQLIEHGHEAAVLAALVPQVFTVERIEELLRQARRRFRQLGIENLRSRHDDGKLGWPDEAPFDAIILTAAGDRMPNQLLDQLKPGGILVAPVGSPSKQTLVRLRKDGQGEMSREDLGAVSFVPLLGGIG